MKKVVIVGAGTAGLSLLNYIHSKRKDVALTIIEPSTSHYYQPLWTLVGAGVTSLEDSRRDTEDFIPKGVAWLKQRVVSFEPDDNQITLDDGAKIGYDYLIVAPGIQVDWDRIEGLSSALGNGGVCSNYSKDTVEYTWQSIKEFKGGNALFTYPDTPIKCAGAPQKIMYLAEETFRSNNLKDKTTISFVSAGAAIFGVKKYKEALEEVIKDRSIETCYGQNLVKVDGETKIAYFKDSASGEVIEKPFDMIHVTPPMSAPNFVKSSPLANDAGWLDLDKHSLRHNRYSNIFGLGDAGSTPNSKTGAAIRSQAPVVGDNLFAALDGRTLQGAYNGYASCPLVTSRSSCILAEFDYDGTPKETFPFNQAKERYSMYVLKRHVIPFMYWNAMMSGRYQV